MLEGDRGAELGQKESMIPHLNENVCMGVIFFIPPPPFDFLKHTFLLHWIIQNLPPTAPSAIGACALSKDYFTRCQCAHVAVLRHCNAEAEKYIKYMKGVQIYKTCIYFKFLYRCKCILFIFNIKNNLSAVSANGTRWDIKFMLYVHVMKFGLNL